jgi:hypothetical protein
VYAFDGICGKAKNVSEIMFPTHQFLHYLLLRFVRDQIPESAIPVHELKPGQWRTRIKWYVNTSGAHNPINGNHGFDAFIEENTHPVQLFQPTVLQEPGNPIRPAKQFGVGETLSIESQRRFLWMTFCRLLEDMRQ